MGMGINISGLHLKRAKNKPTMRVQRYSFQMEMSDVGTTYRIKAWSLEKKRIRSATPVFSESYHREASFDREETSTGLAKSFSLGDGLEEPAVPVQASVSHVEARAPPPRAGRPETIQQPVATRALEHSLDGDGMQLSIPTSLDVHITGTDRLSPYAPPKPTMLRMHNAAPEQAIQVSHTNSGFAPVGRTSDRSVSHESKPVASRRKTGGKLQHAWFTMAGN